MPGRNGTGPLGMGPMTGRGMGYCGHHLRTPWVGRRFWGCGRGIGYDVPQSPAQEKEHLAEMEKALTEQLSEVRRMQAELTDTSDQE
jgi:hypothetical protein